MLLLFIVAVVMATATAGGPCDSVCSTNSSNATCAACVPCAVATDRSNGSWTCIPLLPGECVAQATVRIVCPPSVGAAPVAGEVESTAPALPPIALFFIVAGSLGTFVGLVTLYYRRKHYPTMQPSPPPKEPAYIRRDASFDEHKAEPVALDMAATPKYIPTFSILQDEQEEVGPWVNAPPGRSQTGWSSVDTISSINNDPWLFLRTERNSEVHLPPRTTDTGSERTPSTNLANSYVDRMVSPLAAKSRSKDSFYI
ncbi:hypothetical protein ACHHYP_17108 [Achlya hypogyna]|uniref:Secreted protein n=1 Tax=Achlya hypogyna TaxID=1202772 RepID=A0A1V9Y571_ACHHY|nr:hypothetical protein ACHHYP_17108 [Achlya hypogyna]